VELGRLLEPILEPTRDRGVRRVLRGVVERAPVAVSAMPRLSFPMKDMPSTAICRTSSSRSSFDDWSAFGSAATYAAFAFSLLETRTLFGPTLIGLLPARLVELFFKAREEERRRVTEPHQVAAIGRDLVVVEVELRERMQRRLGDEGRGGAAAVDDRERDLAEAACAAASSAPASMRSKCSPGVPLAVRFSHTANVTPSVGEREHAVAIHARHAELPDGDVGRLVDDDLAHDRLLRVALHLLGGERRPAATRRGARPTAARRRSTR
jgi:hypothetical protein